jgi:hypothetical protein
MAGRVFTNQNWKAIRMPHFYFDLIIGEECRDQGGMILEDTQIAFDKADCLANEISIVRPELLSRGCAVRVTDSKTGNSIVRPLILFPPGSKHIAARDFSMLLEGINRPTCGEGKKPKR